MKPLILALSFLAGPAAAHDATAGSLTIGHPFAIETPRGAMSGAGYMTISNAGHEPDRLIAVRADFPRVTLHRTEVGADSVARMREAAGIVVAPGETVVFEPGGGHIMFIGLEGDPFEVGESIPATLVFEKAGEVPVAFMVELRRGARRGHGEGAASSNASVDHAAHGAPPAGHHRAAGTKAAAIANLPDSEQIEALLMDQFDRPDAPLSVAPVVVRGDVAVAGWSQDDRGGRAFLSRDAHGWAIELCSGESLRQASTLQALGLPEAEAVALAADIAAAEAHDPALTMRLDSFEGTVMVGRDAGQR